MNSPPWSKYPQNFPQQARGRVEAERIHAGRAFDQASQQTGRWNIKKLLRTYLLRIFLVFADEARAQCSVVGR